MVQDVVWAVSIVIMGALAALFAWVAVGANAALADYGPVVASAYRASPWLFGLAIIVLIGVNYETLGKLPYVSSMTTTSSAAAVLPVEVVAEQWAWSIKPNTFQVGQPAGFHVTSKESITASPSTMRKSASLPRSRRCRVTPTCYATPSTIRHLPHPVLEYCGVAHHDMEAELTVAAHRTAAGP